MEDIIAFLASDAGQIFCKVLIFIGLWEIALVTVPFMPLAKVRLKMEKMLLETHQPEEKALLQSQVNAHRTIRSIMASFAVVMIAIGIYGLTR